MNTSRTTLFFVLSLAACLFAGDRAAFLSLGFSPEGQYFAFAQYGEQDGSGFPYAEIYIVDIEKNDFVPGGVIKQLWKDEIDPQAKGLHVLLEMRVAADSLLKAYNIQAQKQGRQIVPVSAAEREQVAWKDENGKPVTVVLRQRSKGDSGLYSSSAAFQLNIHYGEKRGAVVGNFRRFRKYVRRYDIDRVLAARDDRSLVFVIRMTKTGFEGPDIRYMVETFAGDDK